MKRRVGRETVDPSCEIVPRVVVKKERPAPFVKKDIEHVVGKSSKYLKEVTIPYYRKKIENLNYQIKLLRERRDEIKASKKQMIFNAVRRRDNINLIRRRKAYKVTQEKIIKKANEIYTEKIKSFRLNGTNYMDGISTFPAIGQWCAKNEIELNTFSIFILMNHYEWFTLKDAVFFGFTERVARRHVKKLEELQWAYQIHNVKTIFSTTTLGKKKFEEFKSYQSKMLKVLVENLDKKESTDDNMVFKTRTRKFTPKPEPNGDQQKNKK